MPEVVRVVETHIAVETIAYTLLGTRAKNTATFIKLVPNEYIVGAQALGTVNATSTVKNFPKPPRGDRTANISPPMSLALSKPEFHEGTNGADAANATPKRCIAS